MVRWPWSRAEQKADSNQEELQELKQQNQNLQEHLEDLQEQNQDLQNEVEELRSLVYEVAPAQSNLSNRQKDLVAVFLNSNHYRTRADMANELDISESYAGKLMSELKQEIELQEKQVNEKGKKAFKLPENTRKRLLG